MRNNSMTLVVMAFVAAACIAACEYISEEEQTRINQEEFDNSIRKAKELNQDTTTIETDKP